MPEISVWPGLLVGRDLEGRVLLGQAAEGDGHLLLVDLRLGLDGDLDHRLGELHRLELDRLVGRGERVARDDLLDADGRGDVARVDLLDVLAVVGVHHQDAADPLRLAGRDVEHARAGLELARVDAEVGQLADERVGHDLEGERGERLGVVGVAGGRAVLLAAHGLEALDRRHVERARQVGEHGVEQRLDALVLERGAAQHGRELDLERRLADRGDEPLASGSRPPRGSSRRARRRSGRPRRAASRARRPPRRRTRPGSR